MSDVRIGAEMRLHNATIRNARHELGLTQKQVAAKAGVHSGLVTAIETLRLVKVTPSVQKILDVLGLDKDASPEWLDELRGQRVQRIERSVTAELVAQPERLQIEQELRDHSYTADPFDAVADDIERETLMRALAAIPDRERQIIVRRFGIGGRQQETMEEIARDLDGGQYTRERIRQLEGQALARLAAWKEDLSPRCVQP